MLFLEGSLFSCSLKCKPSVQCKCEPPGNSFSNLFSPALETHFIYIYYYYIIDIVIIINITIIIYSGGDMFPQADTS